MATSPDIKEGTNKPKKIKIDYRAAAEQDQQRQTEFEYEVNASYRDAQEAEVSLHSPLNMLVRLIH